MKQLLLITTIWLAIAFTATVGYETEDWTNSRPYQSVRHHIVKRKGGRGGGGGKSRGSSSGRTSHQTPKNRNPEPYPKQPAYNPNYNPNTGHQTGQQHGQHNPSYPNYNPGQQYGHGQQMGYPGQTGYNQNYGQKPNSGGMLGGVLGGSGSGIGQKSKLGLGAGLLGGGAIGGLAGAYGGYKLGRMVGSLGRHGHYGYYNEGRYYPCDPPPRLAYDPEKNTSYIPLDVNYDNRCHYYDNDPRRYSTNYPNNYYHNSRYGVNAQNKCTISGFALFTVFILNYLITKDTTFHLT